MGLNPRYTMWLMKSVLVIPADVLSIASILVVAKVVVS